MGDLAPEGRDIAGLVGRLQQRYAGGTWVKAGTLELAADGALGSPGDLQVDGGLLALGVTGWSMAVAPWQLYGAAMLSGMGWVALGAAAVNALIAANPGFRSADGHLLYARTVEDTGDAAAAIHEYEAVVQVMDTLQRAGIQRVGLAVKSGASSN